MKSKAKALAPPPIQRRDATGHLDPQYAADLRARSKSDRPPTNGTAFLGKMRSGDPLAEELGEEYVHAALSGDAELQADRDRVVAEENGGPFVETSARTELADDIDEANPEDATREPFPTALSGSR